MAIGKPEKALFVCWRVGTPLEVLILEESEPEEAEEVDCGTLDSPDDRVTHPPTRVTRLPKTIGTDVRMWQKCAAMSYKKMQRSDSCCPKIIEFPGSFLLFCVPTRGGIDKK
jgi:hypothetical protein